MEIDSKIFSHDIIIEEKFIPDDDDLYQNDTLTQIDHQNEDQNNPAQDFTQTHIDHQNEDQNSTQDFAKSQLKLQNDNFFKCQCHRRYHTYSKFKGHIKICPIINRGLIVCRISNCHETFKNKADYEAHKSMGSCSRSKNNKLKLNGVFVCDVKGCPSKFDSVEKLSRHKNFIHIPRKFACLYCDLTFKRRCHKTQHELRVHCKKAKIRKNKVKLKISQKKVKIKSEFEIIDNNDTFSGGRITRSQNKKTNFASFFDSEIPKHTGNQPESDGDTSTTASFDEEGANEDILTNSFDEDASSDEDNQDLNVSKPSKVVKLMGIEAEESDEFLCSVCYENFTCKIEAQNHEKKCRNVKKVKVEEFKVTCEYECCDLDFRDIGKYNAHIDKVHLEIQYEMEHRPSRGPDRINKRKSVKERQREKERRLCFLCSKYFKLKKDLEEHTNLPHKINCTKCSRIFVEPAHLERHIKSVHLVELKKFQCPKCPTKFMSEYHLKQHDHVVHRRKTKICPICSKEICTSKFKKHLERHKIGGVRNRKPFCELCQVYLADRAGFERHLKTDLHLEKGTDERTEGEFILPNDFNPLDIFIIAQNKTNVPKSDEGIFDPAAKSTKKSKKSNCHDCGLKFRNFYYREAHREKYHGYKRPEFYCSICDVHFCRQFVLNNHIKKSISHKMKEKKQHQ